MIRGQTGCWVVVQCRAVDLLRDTELAATEDEREVSDPACTTEMLPQQL